MSDFNDECSQVEQEMLTLPKGTTQRPYTSHRQRLLKTNIGSNKARIRHRSKTLNAVLYPFD